MSNIKLTVLIFLLIVTVSLMIHFPTDVEVIYDCNIAEISPDYPQAVKEECRRMLAE